MSGSERGFSVPLANDSEPTVVTQVSSKSIKHRHYCRDSHKTNRNNSSNRSNGKSSNRDIPQTKDSLPPNVMVISDKEYRRLTMSGRINHRNKSNRNRSDNKSPLRGGGSGDSSALKNNDRLSSTTTDSTHNDITEQILSSMERRMSKQMMLQQSNSNSSSHNNNNNNISPRNNPRRHNTESTSQSSVAAVHSSYSSDRPKSKSRVGDSYKIQRWNSDQQSSSNQRSNSSHSHSHGDSRSRSRGRRNSRKSKSKSVSPIVQSSSNRSAINDDSPLREHAMAVVISKHKNGTPEAIRRREFSPVDPTPTPTPSAAAVVNSLEEKVTPKRWSRKRTRRSRSHSRESSHSISNQRASKKRRTNDQIPNTYSYSVSAMADASDTPEILHKPTPEAVSRLPPVVKSSQLKSRDATRENDSKHSSRRGKSDTNNSHSHSRSHSRPHSRRHGNSVDNEIGSKQSTFVSNNVTTDNDSRGSQQQSSFDRRRQNRKSSRDNDRRSIRRRDDSRNRDRDRDRNRSDKDYNTSRKRKRSRDRSNSRNSHNSRNSRNSHNSRNRKKSSDRDKDRQRNDNIRDGNRERNRNKNRDDTSRDRERNRDRKRNSGRDSEAGSDRSSSNRHNNQRRRRSDSRQKNYGSKRDRSSSRHRDISRRDKEKTPDRSLPTKRTSDSPYFAPSDITDHALVSNVEPSSTPKSLSSTPSFLDSPVADTAATNEEQKKERLARLKEWRLQQQTTDTETEPQKKMEDNCSDSKVYRQALPNLFDNPPNPMDITEEGGYSSASMDLESESGSETIDQSQPPLFEEETEHRLRIPDAEQQPPITPSQPKAVSVPQHSDATVVAQVSSHPNPPQPPPHHTTSLVGGSVIASPVSVERPTQLQMSNSNSQPKAPKPTVVAPKSQPQPQPPQSTAPVTQTLVAPNVATDIGDGASDARILPLPIHPERKHLMQATDAVSPSKRDKEEDAQRQREPKTRPKSSPPNGAVELVPKTRPKPSAVNSAERRKSQRKAVPRNKLKSGSPQQPIVSNPTDPANTEEDQSLLYDDMSLRKSTVALNDITLSPEKRKKSISGDGELAEARAEEQGWGAPPEESCVTIDSPASATKPPAPKPVAPPPLQLKPVPVSTPAASSSSSSSKRSRRRRGSSDHKRGSSSSNSKSSKSRSHSKPKPKRRSRRRSRSSSSSRSTTESSSDGSSWSDYDSGDDRRRSAATRKAPHDKHNRIVITDETVKQLLQISGVANTAPLITALKPPTPVSSYIATTVGPSQPQPQPAPQQPPPQRQRYVAPQIQVRVLPSPAPSTSVSAIYGRQPSVIRPRLVQTAPTVTPSSAAASVTVVTTPVATVVSTASAQTTKSETKDLFSQLALKRSLKLRRCEALTVGQCHYIPFIEIWGADKLREAQSAIKDARSFKHYQSLSVEVIRWLDEKDLYYYPQAKQIIKSGGSSNANTNTKANAKAKAKATTTTTTTTHHRNNNNSSSSGSGSSSSKHRHRSNKSVPAFKPVTNKQHLAKFLHSQIPTKAPLSEEVKEDIVRRACDKVMLGFQNYAKGPKEQSWDTFFKQRETKIAELMNKYVIKYTKHKSKDK